MEGIINLQEKLAMFNEHWTPKIIAELDGQYVKLAKVKGEMVWHKHDDEDELFYIIKGTLTLHMRDKTVQVKEGEIFVVPKGEPGKEVADILKGRSRQDTLVEKREDAGQTNV